MRKIINILLFFILLFKYNCIHKATHVYHEPATGMEFVLIKHGQFLIGTPETGLADTLQSYQHEVEITKDFYLGKCEVTQGEWEKLMGSNPSHFKGNDSLPVENVTWYEAKKFIDKLNQINNGKLFRLPTEAEWEYACRAGTTTPFSTGKNITTDQANYDGDFPYKNYPKGINRNHTTIVGTFKPNPWGLYDMNGNVWEWCEDWYCPYPKIKVADPVGNCKTDLKVIRGGSWYFVAKCARSDWRYTHNPNNKGFSLGFRVLMEVNE